MNASTSRAVATSAIWLAVAIGLWGAAPVGQSEPGVYLVICIVLGSGATLSTAVVWLTGRRKQQRRERHGFEVVRPAERVEAAGNGS